MNSSKLKCAVLLDKFVDLEGEEWRKVKYLPPHVEISSKGRVRIYRTPTHVELMKLSTSSGYKHFSVQGKNYAVHRVVADSFLPPTDIKNAVVNHINGIKDDNKAENLEWVTNQSNLAKSYNWGTDSRKKLYCVETDQIFGTLRSACAIYRLPQEVVSEKIKHNQPIAGLTFKYIAADDPMLKNHSIFHIDGNTIFNLAGLAQSPEELHRMILGAVGDGITINTQKKGN